MAEFEKVDMVCIGFMIVVVLATAGYMAVFSGWTVVNGIPVWMGWIWWVVVAIVIGSVIIIILSSRKRQK